MNARAGSVRSGAKVAAGDWTGAAESGFAVVASHVVTVYETLGGVVDDAGRTLSNFAQDLAAAQKITKQALHECQTFDQQATSSQQQAAAHGQTVQTLAAHLATAVHPAQSAELTRQLNTAQDQQAAAERAAGQAQGQLQSAERQGARAWTEYQQQAQTAARALDGLTARIQKVEQLPGAAGPGVSAGAAAAGAGVGFWPVFNSVVGSPLSDASIGFAEGVLRRYRNSDLLLPITKQASQGLEQLSGDLGGGDPFTLAPIGLWVPKGSSADPLLGQIESMTSGDGFNTPGSGFFVPGEEDLAASAPSWASIGGRALGVFGVGMTLYSTGGRSVGVRQHPPPGVVDHRKGGGHRSEHRGRRWLDGGRSTGRRRGRRGGRGRGRRHDRLSRPGRRDRSRRCGRWRRGRSRRWGRGGRCRPRSGPRARGRGARHRP